MKTVFINGSPKKSFSASSYFLGIQRFFTGGIAVKEKLRGKADYERILGELKDADNAVFCLPLYIDGVPSHFLSFMKELESFCRENKVNLNIYAVSNSGFIEGNQSRPMFRVFENFCARSGNRWCGGVGIGGGVMLNVTRILFVVNIALLLLEIVLSGVQTDNWLPTNELIEFSTSALLLLFLNLGVFIYTLRMGCFIKKGKPAGERFTRILIPSFIFIIIADIFFTIISVFKGGIFKGWFSKKKPSIN